MLEFAFADSAQLPDCDLDVALELLKQYLNGCLRLGEPLRLSVHEVIEPCLLCGEACRSMLEPLLNSC